LTIRICVSIQPENASDIQRMMIKAEASRADFIEVRLDELISLGDLQILKDHHKTPLIVADHSHRPEVERQMMIVGAAKWGFGYVDIDLQTPKLQKLIAQAKAEGLRCIVSSHDYYKTPDVVELNRILEREVSSGADVFKIVTTAKRLEDNLTLLQFIQSAPIRKKPICFAMGELGRTSRLLSPVFGSFFTFASLDQGSETASGQMTVQEMRSAYELLKLC
jgi:3-dehydroquinate dehydratase type I